MQPSFDTPQFYHLLKRELMIAMGCTEPAAAALAGAKAKELLSEEALRYEITASRDMVKNALGVALPNSSLMGIQAAVALGVASGEVAKGLAILSEIDEEQQREALEIEVSLTLATEAPPSTSALRRLVLTTPARPPLVVSTPASLASKLTIASSSPSRWRLRVTPPKS